METIEEGFENVVIHFTHFKPPLPGGAVHWHASLFNHVLNKDNSVTLLFVLIEAAGSVDHFDDGVIIDPFPD